MAKKKLPLAKVYRLLEPGPVVLLTTLRDGCANVMPMSWLTMMEFEPPQVGLIISENNYSFASLKKSGECVINIPTVAIARQVVGCGNCSGAKTDKFRKFGLTAVPAAQVKPPLIEECYASLECRVIDDRLAARYGLFVVEVVQAWVDRAERNPQTLHHRGRGNFMVAGATIRLKTRVK